MTPSNFSHRLGPNATQGVRSMNTSYNLLPRASWLRPKYLLFGFVGLMLVYVIPHDESFLVHSNDPI